MQKQISTLIGIIIIAVSALIFMGGAFAFQYFATKANNTQIVGLPVQSQRATEGWKTYTNESIGYEINYPPDYNVKNHEWVAGDGQRAPEFDWVSVDSNSLDSEGNSLVSLGISNYSGTFSDFITKDFIPAVIAGHSSYKYEFEAPGGGIGWYYIQKENSGILFIEADWSYSGVYPNTIKDEVFKQRKQTIDQMLSTFKFTK